LASHRFSRQSSSALVVYATTRPAALSCAPWGSFTHTQHCKGGMRHCQKVWRSPQTAVTLTETRLQLLQRVRDVATLIRRCWCRRDAKHTRGACLGGRDRLSWRALGRAGESEHTCGGHMQSSLEATHLRVRSELGCHSHRFLRRPRQSSRALALPPNALLLSAVHPVTPYTHTGRQGHAPLPAGWCALSPNHHQASLDAPLSRYDV
jgi:hypothetical protein